jgi:menaquinol-cytochrome c reductase cytochrome b/c subunit
VNEEHKQQYKEKYAQAKQKGVKFWPDIIYKDLLISLAFFILLVILATFVGVAAEPKADPSDASYVPRPEWYFLFLFEMLKFVPPKLEWVGATVIPGIAVLAMFLLPFFDRNPRRHWKQRKIALAIMGVIVLGMVGLTVRAVATTPVQEETTVAGTLAEQVVAGQDLYSVNCVECHGADGEGGEIIGVEGLEGVVVKPIHSKDEMYTRSDDTFRQIIAYGQQDLGMPPFSKAFGGALSASEIDYIVAFMRYTWDDRMELPAAAAQPAIPALGADEVPSYEVHIQPIIKRYCISCHRPGKKNNNYTVATYQEVMTSGDQAPNVIPGDLTSNLIRMINREEIEAGGPMPPTKPLPPELVDIFTRWVQAGAPNLAADAAALQPAAPAEPTSTPAP